LILTAGLTPAWQQILLFDSFHEGQVNRAREAHWTASGKVFNAGIGVHCLGEASLTLATVGGSLQVQIERELNELGVPWRFVQTKSATRVCTTILDRATGRVTELVENGRPLLPEELDAFRQAYAEEAAKADVAILIGSLPVETPATFYRDLVERTPCPVVLDFRGEGLLSVLDLKPYVVKPNREELARTMGRPLDTDEELIDAMRSLNDRGAQWVVITQGDGPVWVTSASETYHLQPPKVDQIVNPIGCGDAMAAAIACATRQGCEPIEAIRRGIAAAANNLTELLSCRLDPSRVEELSALVTIEKAK
jgi:tagatose 6-phosphate kinase